MGTPYPATIATDKHISEALIATATKGVDVMGLLGADRVKVELCVRNWALRNGVKEDLAIEVSRTEKRTTPFINERLKSDPQIAGAWAMPWEEQMPDDGAIDTFGVERLRCDNQTLTEDKLRLSSTVNRLSSDLTLETRYRSQNAEERDAAKKKVSELEKQLTDLGNEMEHLRKGYVPDCSLKNFLGDLDRSAFEIAIGAETDKGGFVYMPKLIEQLRHHWFTAGQKFARMKKKAA